jgi:hypothetical protein
MGTSGFVPFNPNDARQFARAFREWTGDAEQLRRELAAAGVNPKDLDEVIRDLRQFGDDRGYADVKGLEKLQAAALERLQQFEFSLRKKADPNQESLALSGSDEVPSGFRSAIEEYYRQLAKNNKK